MAGPLAVAKIERPIEMLPENALHTEEKKKIQESEKHSKKENRQQTVKDLQEQENTQSDQTDPDSFMPLIGEDGSNSSAPMPRLPT